MNFYIESNEFIARFDNRWRKTEREAEIRRESRYQTILNKTINLMNKLNSMRKSLFT